MSEQLPDAYYLPDGEGYVASALTIGPWNVDQQHGGPPAALLVRAIEAITPSSHQLVRVVVAYHRPAPVATVGVRAELIRTGRKVAVARAELTVDGTTVTSVEALLLRRDAVEVPAQALREEPPPPGPAGCAPWTFPFFRIEVAYHRSLEMRLARGTVGEGRFAAWMRPRVPTVRGEIATPWQRVIACADAAQGVGFVLPLTEYTFLNPDLSVYLHREPVGEWLCLDARTVAGPTGIGVCDTRLFDERGAIGRIVQSQLVERR